MPVSSFLCLLHSAEKLRIETTIKLFLSFGVKRKPNSNGKRVQNYIPFLKKVLSISMKEVIEDVTPGKGRQSWHIAIAENKPHMPVIREARKKKTDKNPIRLSATKTQKDRRSSEDNSGFFFSTLPSLPKPVVPNLFSAMPH